MINNLRKIWDKVSGQKYATVASLTARVNWSDTGGSDSVTYYLQETAQGKRRFTANYTSFLFKPENTTAHNSIILPWVNKLKDFQDIYSYSPNIVVNPHIYAELDYKLVGKAEINTTFEDKPLEISYYFYEHENGQRRYTKKSNQSLDINLPKTEQKYKDWQRGLLDLEELPYVIPPKARAQQKQAADAIEHIEDNIIVADFGKNEPQ